MRVGLAALPELDRLECGLGALLDRAVGHGRVTELKREDDVLEGVEPGQQPLLLVDERNLPSQPSQLAVPPAAESPPSDEELAPIGTELAVDEAEQRRLARPARARHLHELPRGNAEVDALEDLAFAEGLDDPDQLYGRLGHGVSVGRRSLSGGARVTCAIAVDPDFGRVDAASCRWSASHPVDPD